VRRPRRLWAYRVIFWGYVATVVEWIVAADWFQVRPNPWPVLLLSVYIIVLFNVLLYGDKGGTACTTSTS